MNNQQAYNAWSKTYDAVENKTRDVEARALRETVTGENLDILELGCGTGKNTVWLLEKAARLVAADFSAEMLAKARAKITDERAGFRQMDLREDWSFEENSFDLITCSLVLEHIEDLDFIFAEARRVLRPAGRFYIGELHPFKQYEGSKARFETGAGVFELECFTHHVSEYFAAAKKNGFRLIDLGEWFDEGAARASSVPRVLSLLFENAK
jgi:ubiquinone/menaquinone biosynthesis C-methylase UbiE